jgi:hypothetical protein
MDKTLTPDPLVAHEMVEQLSRALPALEQGRMYGLGVYASPACLSAMKKSGHPMAEVVAGNINVQSSFLSD